VYREVCCLSHTIIGGGSVQIVLRTELFEVKDGSGGHIVCPLLFELVDTRPLSRIKWNANPNFLIRCGSQTAILELRHHQIRGCEGCRTVWKILTTIVQCRTVPGHPTRPRTSQIIAHQIEAINHVLTRSEVSLGTFADSNSQQKPRLVSVHPGTQSA
jgi:hypothetical protein